MQKPVNTNELLPIKRKQILGCPVARKDWAQYGRIGNQSSNEFHSRPTLFANIFFIF